MIPLNITGIYITFQTAVKQEHLNKQKTFIEPQTTQRMKKKQNKSFLTDHKNRLRKQYTYIVQTRKNPSVRDQRRKN